jgi:hypothetical protein
MEMPGAYLAPRHGRIVSKRVWAASILIKWPGANNNFRFIFSTIILSPTGAPGPLPLS